MRNVASLLADTRVESLNPSRLNNIIRVSLAYCENAVSLLVDPRVESLNPGRVNKINRVSKFSSI